MNVSKNSLLEFKKAKPKFKPSYENVNCSKCESEDCPYREENKKPFYFPKVEQDRG